MARYDIICNKLYPVPCIFPDSANAAFPLRDLASVRTQPAFNIPVIFKIKRSHFSGFRNKNTLIRIGMKIKLLLYNDSSEFDD